jgi:hypothetical protein
MFSKNTLFFSNEFIDAFIHLTNVNKDSKILEIRTAKKLVTIPLFYKGLNTLSVDLYPDKNSKNSIFHNLTIEKANFPANTFDLVYSTNALHELNYSYFEKTYQILKPTGCLAIVEIKPIIDNDNEFLKEFDQKIISKYFKNVYKPIDEMDFSKPTFKSILFKHLSTSIYYKSKSYNAKEYMEDIMKGFPEIENLPTSIHNEMHIELDTLIKNEFASGKLKRRYAIILYLLQKKEIQLKLNIDI